MKYRQLLSAAWALALVRATPIQVSTDALGRTIHCIAPESQIPTGTLPRIPPPPRTNTTHLTPPPPACPRGTVPSLPSTPLLPRAQYVREGVAQHAGATTYAGVANHGGGATFFSINPRMPPAASSGTSVLQLALSHAAGTASFRQQTVDAGITMQPQQHAAPILFTYFTTVAHAATGDHVGGYNADQRGWVQVDPHVYPGMYADAVARASEITISYVLHAGNWWLWVQDRYIGYYPGSLFGGALGSGAEQISMFGEVFNRQGYESRIPMGTGVVPTPQSDQVATCDGAAYIRNAFYYDSQGNYLDFDGAAVLNEQPQVYGVQTHFNSPTPWRSFICVGGGGY